MHSFYTVLHFLSSRQWGMFCQQNGDNCKIIVSLRVLQMRTFCILTYFRRVSKSRPVVYSAPGGLDQPCPALIRSPAPVCGSFWGRSNSNLFYPNPNLNYLDDSLSSFSWQRGLSVRGSVSLSGLPCHLLMTNLCIRRAINSL